MTRTEHLIAFVAMAAAIVTILVIGTLGAADILHLGSRTQARSARPSERRRSP